MKKYFIFIIALFGCCGFAKESFFKNVEFDSKANFNLKEDSTYSVNFGGKINLKGISLRIFDSSEILNFDEEFLLKNPQIGVAADFYSLFKIPINIKFGNLTFSGVSSKLNSPSLSSYVSGFSNSVSNLRNFSVSLPTISSSQKDLAVSVSSFLKFKEILLKNITFSVFCDENLKFAAGINSEFDFLNNKFEVAYSVLFSKVSRTEDLWNLEHKVFPETQVISSLFETKFASKYFDSTFSVNIYENPFGKADFCFTTQNKLKVRFFSVGFQGFFTSADEILTSSGKYLQVRQQYKIIPQIKILFSKNFLINFGISGLIEEKKYSVFEDSNYFAKFSNGIEFKSLNNSTKVSVSISDLIFSSSESEIFSKSKIGINLKSYFYKFLNSLVSINFSYFPRTEFQEFSGESSAYFAGYFFKDKKLRSSAKINIEFNSDKVKSLKPEISISYRNKFKYISLNLSCGINYLLKI